MNFGFLVSSLISYIVRKLEKNKKVKDLVLPLFERAMLDGALPDNAARRAWVAGILMTQYGLPETEAFWLVQSAYKVYQKIRAKLAKKAAKKTA